MNFISVTTRYSFGSGLGAGDKTVNVEDSKSTFVLNIKQVLLTNVKSSISRKIPLLLPGRIQWTLSNSNSQGGL